MRTKFFVIVLCLSFALLITMSGTIMVQNGMCQGFGYDLGGGHGATGHIAAGVLLNMSGNGNGPALIGSSPQAHIIAGALTNNQTTGSVVAGALLHLSGFSSMSIPGQTDLEHSWGIRTADYYFHDFFLDPFMGLGDYLNYMKGLQFKGAGSSVAALGFPMPSGAAYNPSLPLMPPSDLNWLNSLENPTKVKLPWQSMFETSVPGYKYDPTHPQETSPIISDTGPGAIWYIPGGMWGGRLSAAPLFPNYYDF